MQFAFRLVLSDCCKINSRYKREQKRSNKKTDSNGDKIDINLPRNSLNTNIKRGIQQKRCNGKRDWKCLRMVLGSQVESFSFINDEKRIQAGVFFSQEDFERVIAIMADGHRHPTLDLCPVDEYRFVVCFAHLSSRFTNW